MWPFNLGEVSGWENESENWIYIYFEAEGEYAREA